MRDSNPLTSPQYDRESFEKVNLKRGSPLDITFLRPKLEASTAILAEGHQAVCLFVNDDASAEVKECLHDDTSSSLILHPVSRCWSDSENLVSRSWRYE